MHGGHSVSDSAPLVSICMPAYNAGNYILQAVDSVLAQSYKNIELIIIDDGSTDHTGEQLQKITDIRVKKYHQENKGQCNAVNRAFEFSKGSLVKFMDADDLISPYFIANQVSELTSHSTDIAVASWGRFYNDDLATFKLNENLIEKDCRPIDWLLRSAENAQIMMQCALWLIPRSILNQSGLWDERLSLINDFEFFIRVLLKAETIRFADDAILYYRSGLQNSLSKLKTRQGVESAFLATRLGTSYMLLYECSERVREAAADYFQNFIYTFYPGYPDLIAQAETRVKELGGSKLPFPSGGYTKLLSGAIGWKTTKKIKHLFGIGS